MKVVLESTSQRETVVLNMPSFATVWRGRTESGLEVVAYVVVLAAVNDADKSLLQRELAAG